MSGVRQSGTVTPGHYVTWTTDGVIQDGGTTPEPNSVGPEIQQSGNVTPGHVAIWVTDGVVQDGGPANDGGLTELGVTKNGGIAIGINSGATSGPFYELGFGVSNDGTATVYANGFDGDNGAELVFNINGVNYPFNPSGGGNITGPGTSVSGDLVAFNGTGGNLVEDSGIAAGNVVQNTGTGTVVAGDLLAFNGTTGRKIQDSGVAASSIPSIVSGAIITIATIADLRSATVTTLPQGQCYALGYYSGADGGDGPFWYNSTDTTSSDNGGTVIVDASSRRWYRETSGAAYNARWFGAKLDGTTDDTTAWQDLILAARESGVAMYHPGGNSIFTGNMVLKNETIKGVGSYYAPPNGAITQDSMITFHGNGAGITLLDANSGGITLEKIGFSGVPGTYTDQIGFLMSDTLRSSQNEGWPTLRDVLFANFNIGMDVGVNYQTGWIFNVFFLQSVAIGYLNQSTDWYHYAMTCGSSENSATQAQAVFGTATPSSSSVGSHLFFGCLFFGGANAVQVYSAFDLTFIGCYFQNSQMSGLVIGDSTHGTAGHIIDNCTFSGNNIAGGERNVNGLFNYDISVDNSARGITISNCEFAQAGLSGICPAAGVGLGGTNNTGIQIYGCKFNMDLIVTPGAPGAPVAISLPTAVQLTGGPFLSVGNNIASYGEQSVLPLEVLPVDMTSLFGALSTNGTITIEARGIYLGGTTAATLPNPSYYGRTLTISGDAGTVFTCATTNALGGVHTAVTFGAGGWIQLCSSGAVNWTILGSNAVTYS